MESKKPENPSAFPMERHESAREKEYPQKGMTLRDYFANSAMQGMLSCYDTSVSFETIENEAEDLALTSYVIADAMLKQREL